MGMDYDFTSSTYQQLHGANNQLPPLQQQQQSQLQAASQADFHGQYVSQLLAQSQNPYCELERNQTTGQPLHGVLGMMGHGIGEECATSTAPTQYHTEFNTFDKSFNFSAALGALPTPQGPDNVSSPLLLGDVGMQQPPRHGKGSSFTGSESTAPAAHDYLGCAPLSTNNAGDRPTATLNQKAQSQLRHLVSNASSSQQRQHENTDEMAVLNTMVEKSVSSGEDKDDNLQNKRKAQNRAA
ncbi:hypothetical protein KEM54_000134 [Ascosphaera aggregata]|nr:hypothetical protein KEM54_000134 [Ascosphaera aggregata]